MFLKFILCLVYGQNINNICSQVLNIIFYIKIFIKIVTRKTFYVLMIILEYKMQLRCNRNKSQCFNYVRVHTPRRTLDNDVTLREKTLSNIPTNISECDFSVIILKEKRLNEYICVQHECSSIKTFQPVTSPTQHK